MKQNLILLLLFISTGLQAQTADSLRFENSRLFRATYMAVPLIAGGLLEKHYDSKFRSLRNELMPEYDYPLDNVSQYTPLAVMYALKAAGVPSRSSWKRMIISDAASAAIMFSVVRGLKHATNVTRPDGSDNHSFPSGHTATAFMAATMLSKEYGHISPWISAGAYTVAAGTGLMRVANNKHWISDVMVGAGFGILSTEFGYWIVDALMKDKGLNIRDRQGMAFYDLAKPSFLSLYLGFNVPLSNYDIDEQTVFKTSTGATLGFEGAWFLNRYIGLGGRATMSDMQFIVNNTEAPNNTLRFYSVAAGPYFSLPLTPRWLVGTKALAAYTKYKHTTIGDRYVKDNYGWGFATGLSLDYRVEQMFRVGLFGDYNIQPPHSIKSGEYLHTLTLGFRAGLSF